MSLGLPGKTLPGRRGQRQAFQHGGVTPSAHVMGDGNPEGWGWLGVAGGGQNFEFSFHSETVSHLGMIGIQQWVSQWKPLGISGISWKTRIIWRSFEIYKRDQQGSKARTNPCQRWFMRPSSTYSPPALPRSLSKSNLPTRERCVCTQDSRLTKLCEGSMGDLRSVPED